MSINYSTGFEQLFAVRVAVVTVCWSYVPRLSQTPVGTPFFDAAAYSTFSSAAVGRHWRHGGGSDGGRERRCSFSVSFVLFFFCFFCTYIFCYLSLMLLFIFSSLLYYHHYYHYSLYAC